MPERRRKSRNRGILSRNWVISSGERISGFILCLTIQDEEAEEELRQSQKNEMILEADIPFLGAAVADKKYGRPANPQFCILAEARSQMVIRTEMTEPDEDARETMAELIAGFIENVGAPKEIRVSNLILQNK